jgi:uncharacterized membrane protein
MRSLLRHSTSMAALAAAVFYLDPVSGARRRALLRDRFTSLGRRLENGVHVAARDAGHRLRGLFAAACQFFDRHEVSDEVLKERVRARLGRCVSHPGAIEVTAVKGRIRLRGPILANEHDCARREICSVSGVTALDDELLVHESPAHVSALQGGRPRHHRFELRQDNWSPAARLLMGAIGTGAMLYWIRRRGALGALGMGAGALLLTRAAANTPIRRLVNVTGGFSVEVHKGIQIHAPVAEVFETLSDIRNFPRFMRNVRSVRMNPDGSSHWTVVGPAGASVKWDSVTTQLEPNALLAWRTVPRSAVEHSGRIRFAPVSGGESTRLEVHLSYRPPAGALGHLVARLFGADPKKEIAEDLLRLKTFLETGKQPRDAAVGRQEIQGERITGERHAGNGELAARPLNLP